MRAPPAAGAVVTAASSCGLAGVTVRPPCYPAAAPHLGALLIPRSISTSQTRRPERARAPSSDPRRGAAPALGNLPRPHAPDSCCPWTRRESAQGQILIPSGRAGSQGGGQGVRQSDSHCLWGRARKQLDSAAGTVSDTRWRTRGAPRLVASPRSPLPPPAAPISAPDVGSTKGGEEPSAKSLVLLLPWARAQGL